MNNTLIENLKHLAVRAGTIILEVREKGTENACLKLDESPVTLADLESNKVLCEGLRELSPNIPILSEEMKRDEYEERAKWSEYWCIDPLDGTKEFIKGSDDFTVNIALVVNNKPLLGIVYAPATKTLYWNDFHKAYKEQNGEVKEIYCKKLTKDLVVSYSEAHKGCVDKLIGEVGDLFSSVTVKVAGSSIKICNVAEGVSDIYPRLHGTCEWDIAAAHAILLKAGGDIVTIDRKPFLYNKPDLENPWFIAFGDETTISKISDNLEAVSILHNP